MTFTKEPPQKSGFYFWRRHNLAFPVLYLIDDVGVALSGMKESPLIPEYMGGEWCYLRPAKKEEIK